MRSDTLRFSVFSFFPPVFLLRSPIPSHFRDGRDWGDHGRKFEGHPDRSWQGNVGEEVMGHDHERWQGAHLSLFLREMRLNSFSFLKKSLMSSKLKLLPKFKLSNSSVSGHKFQGLKQEVQLIPLSPSPDLFCCGQTD